MLKRVLRILIILTGASFVYYIRLYILHPEYGFSLKYFFYMIHGQPFITPFWFLYTYTAFLIILPFIRRMALGMTKTEYDYLILLCLIFGFFMFFVNKLFGIDNYLKIPVFSTGLIYPLIGYYVDAVFDPNKLTSIFGKIIPFNHGKYVAIAVSLILVNGIACAGLTYNDFLSTGEWTYKYIESMTFIPAFCIFYIIRTIFIMNPLSNISSRIISYIGSCSFTMYLLEEMLREDICMNIYTAWAGHCPNLILFIPYALSIYILGITIASLLKLIPGINKLL